MNCPQCGAPCCVIVDDATENFARPHEALHCANCNRDFALADFPDLFAARRAELHARAYPHKPVAGRALMQPE